MQGRAAVFGLAAWTCLLAWTAQAAAGCLTSSVHQTDRHLAARLGWQWTQRPAPCCCRCPTRHRPVLHMAARLNTCCRTHALSYIAHGCSTRQLVCGPRPRWLLQVLWSAVTCPPETVLVACPPTSCDTRAPDCMWWQAHRP